MTQMHSLTRTCSLTRTSGRLRYRLFSPPRPATRQTSDSELCASNSDLHVSDSDLAGPIHHAADLRPNGVTGCGTTLNGAVSADGDLP